MSEDSVLVHASLLVRVGVIVVASKSMDYRNSLMVMIDLRHWIPEQDIEQVISILKIKNDNNCGLVAILAMDESKYERKPDQNVRKSCIFPTHSFTFTRRRCEAALSFQVRRRSNKKPSHRMISIISYFAIFINYSNTFLVDHNFAGSAAPD